MRAIERTTDAQVVYKLNQSEHDYVVKNCDWWYKITADLGEIQICFRAQRNVTAN